MCNRHYRSIISLKTNVNSMKMYFDNQFVSYSPSKTRGG